MDLICRVLLSAVMLVAVTACSDDNPILGEWRVQEGPENMATDTISFTDAEVVTGGAVDSVSYQIDGNRITVTGSLGFDVIYTLEDENTLSVNLPGTGRVVYTRSTP